MFFVLCSLFAPILVLGKLREAGKRFFASRCSPSAMSPSTLTSFLFPLHVCENVFFRFQTASLNFNFYSHTHSGSCFFSCQGKEVLSVSSSSNRDVTLMVSLGTDLPFLSCLSVSLFLSCFSLFFLSCFFFFFPPDLFPCVLLVLLLTRGEEVPQRFHHSTQKESGRRRESIFE